jgi:hypothetical protein
MTTPQDPLARWAQVAGDEDAVWATAVPGPSVDAIAARLSSIPRPFLDDRVSLPALCGDVLGLQSVAALEFSGDPVVRAGTAMGLWLVASEELVAPFGPALLAVNAPRAVDALGMRLAPVADPARWLVEDERREEAVRLFLLWSGMLPAGEDRRTARSLLEARDSLRRNAALAEAYAEHRHRAEVARRLAEAKAKEAAARYSHE